MTDASHLTRAYIHLDRLSHNLRLLQGLVGGRPMWPAIKANAYGHGMTLVARHLVGLGYDTFCVAHVSEALALRAAGIDSRLVLLSAGLPEHAEAIVEARCEPAVCTPEMVTALDRAANSAGRQIAMHLMVDTGMGRIGICPDDVPAFLDHVRQYPTLRVRGIMSHFPCADEADKTLSLQELTDFEQVRAVTASEGIEVFHMANSAAIFDLPGSHLDVVRPGISIYGLKPSADIANPRVAELQPVLEWRSRLTFLKEVPAGTGLSYGHTYHTKRASLIATVPVGYGDGLSRGLSNQIDMLVCGVRCPQVGRITMDQCLLDVSELRGRVRLGDEVTIIGQQGGESIAADELALRLGTINYEIVTQIAQRVPRVIVEQT